MEGRDDIPGFARRTVLKSAAVAAVGVGAFSGTASATTPDQINFCGCSQVCVHDPDASNSYQVVLAKEPYDFEDFVIVDTVRGGNEQLGNSFCYELTEEEQEDGYKVIAVRPRGGSGSPGSSGRTAVCIGRSEDLFCNPGTCAEKALAVLKTETFCDTEGAKNSDVVPACQKDSDVRIVQGRCGKPGRTPPGRQGRNGPPE